MGAVDTPQASSRGGKKKKARIAIRIDMTPMVDVAFLLLIFFMVTTVFRLPQAMEINLPPESETAEEVEVHESDLLYLRVDKNDSLWYSIGFENPQLMSWTNLRQLLEKQKEATRIPDRRNPGKYKINLTVVAKINRQAKYQRMVDLLDEFNYMAAIDTTYSLPYSLLRYDASDDSLVNLKGQIAPGKGL